MYGTPPFRGYPIDSSMRRIAERQRHNRRQRRRRLVARLLSFSLPRHRRPEACPGC